MATPSRPRRKYRPRQQPRTDPATQQQLYRVRRLRANHRERHRMQTLNEAMKTLWNVLPSCYFDDNLKRSEKMTKIETLRVAYQYISDLREMLARSDALPEPEEPANSCQRQLAWSGNFLDSERFRADRNGFSDSTVENAAGSVSSFDDFDVFGAGDPEWYP